MMFIVRTLGEAPAEAGFTIRQARRTPALASGGTHDFFCDGDPDVAKAAGLNVVMLHDGWWADDHGGGVAIWGQGRFWEIRDTPFSVKESCDAPAMRAEPGATDKETVNVRDAIFGV